MQITDRLIIFLLNLTRLNCNDGPEAMEPPAPAAPARPAASPAAATPPAPPVLRVANFNLQVIYFCHSFISWDHSSITSACLAFFGPTIGPTFLLDLWCLWLQEFCTFVFHQPVFKKMISASLNSLQQKEYQVVVKNWIYVDSFHKKRTGIGQLVC